MNLSLTPLHEEFGVEVHGVDLREVTSTNGYAEIRDAFEAHSLLLFRGQDLDDEAHLRFGALWGPIEDRSFGAMGTAPRMANVSNVLDDGSILSADDLRLLDLTGNQLWHTDSIFLPVPALINVLAARVLSSTGGETELVSTRSAWSRLPEELKAQLRSSVVTHRLAHSRRNISTELFERHLGRFADTKWKAVWPNPVNGLESLYVASHSCAIDGLAESDAQALLDNLIEDATQPEHVYSHKWQLGDVLVWDERATMHRGRPWPYNEGRTLASICVSVQDVDGFASIHP